MARTNTHQWLVGALLIFLLALTRGQHFASFHSLPGATWSVFFLAGVYLRPVSLLPILLAVVWTLDFTPYLLSGESFASILSGKKAFCLTPSYGFLVPAYGSLWLAGRWFARHWSTIHYSFSVSALLPLLASALLGAFCCNLFSSGGFYFMSGHFSDPNLAEFAQRIGKYLPGYLQSLGFYLGIAVLIHGTVRLALGINTTRQAH